MAGIALHGAAALLAFVACLLLLGPPHAGRRGRGAALAPSARGLALVAGRLLEVVEGYGPVARARVQVGSSRVRMGCLREMPSMLDVVTLGLLSGLSFEIGRASCRERV